MVSSTFLVRDQRTYETSLAGRCVNHLIRCRLPGTVGHRQPTPVTSRGLPPSRRGTHDYESHRWPPPSHGTDMGNTDTDHSANATPGVRAETRASPFPGTDPHAPTSRPASTRHRPGIAASGPQPESTASTAPEPTRQDPPAVPLRCAAYRFPRLTPLAPRLIPFAAFRAGAADCTTFTALVAYAGTGNPASRKM